MKRIFPLLVVVTMLYTLCVPAFAVEDDADPASSETEEVVQEAETASGESTESGEFASSDTPEVEEALEEEFVEEELDPDLLYASVSLDDMEFSYTTLPAAIVGLFGEYQPRTQTVTEYFSDGSTVEYTQIVPGLAGLDWTWIASVFIFALALYCVFRAIGGMLR